MASFRSTISRFLPERVKAIYRGFRTHDLSSPLAIGSFGQYQVAYRKGTADESVLEHSFGHDIFFAGVPEYEPGPDHIILDVGAHIGTFSLFASSIVPRGKVYAIEAAQDSFNFLRINVALNKADNISLHHIALTDRRGDCTLYHDSGNWGHSVVKRLSSRCETVGSIGLADFLEDNNIQHCDFMKLNCEGAEFPILLSATSATLQKFSTILVLYHCDLWRLNSEKDLMAHLESGGLRSVIRNDAGRRGWLIATNDQRDQSAFSITAESCRAMTA